jgi:hypothetical protein
MRGDGGLPRLESNFPTEVFMKPMSFASAAALSAAVAIASTAFAQAPAGSTGLCKDGSYTQAESKRGACAGHGGVKTWYASDKKATATAAPAPAPAAAAPAAAAPKATTTASSKKASEGMRTEAAPGGGAGRVWVNTSSKVYHCPGDEWYGKTKEGEYMSEAQAKASGAHASRNKSCS